MGVETNSGGSEESELAAGAAPADDRDETVRDTVRRGRRTKVTTYETEEPEEEMVTLIVAPGRTVSDGEKVYTPGTQIEVSRKDAVLLASSGHAKAAGRASDIAPQTGPKVRDDLK